MPRVLWLTAEARCFAQPIMVQNTCRPTSIFHAYGDVAGNQEALDWLLPHIATAYDALVIVGGGLNANAGWASGLSVASGPVCDQLTEFLSTAGLHRCAPTPDVPTWVSS